MIDLDFETRSAVDIKLGPWRYSEDKTTSILCFAYAFGGGKAHLWLPGDPMPIWVKDRLWELLGAASVRAHNAMFEKAVWRNVLVARYGWPDIPDGYWKCSAAKCAAHALPRALGPATVVMNTAVKKDDEGHRVMLKLSKPRKPTKNNPKFGTSQKTRHKIFRLCINTAKLTYFLKTALMKKYGIFLQENNRSGS